MAPPISTLHFSVDGVHSPGISWAASVQVAKAEQHLRLRGRQNGFALTLANSLATPTDSRWISLIVLCAGFLMVVVDSTIVNVALPSIQRDLGFTQADLAWVVNAYLIAYA